jgi:hypothetical protein
VRCGSPRTIAVALSSDSTPPTLPFSAAALPPLTHWEVGVPMPTASCHIDCSVPLKAYAECLVTAVAADPAVRDPAAYDVASRPRVQLAACLLARSSYASRFRRRGRPAGGLHVADMDYAAGAGGPSRSGVCAASAAFAGVNA